MDPVNGKPPELENRSSMYDIGFQKQVLKMIASNVKFTMEYGNLIREEYFDLKSFRILFRIYYDYVMTYESELDNTMLSARITDYLQPRGFTEDAYRTLMNESKEIYKTFVSSEQSVKDQLIRFCRNQGMARALSNGIDSLEKGRGYETILNEIQDVIAIGAGNDLGYSLKDFSTVPDIIAEKYDRTKLVKIGFPDFDEALLGGMAPGELHVIMAPPKTGKTMFGVNVGANIAAMGKKVAHISLEITREELLLRYTSKFFRVSLTDLQVMPKDKYMEKVNSHDFSSKFDVRLMSWPEGEATTLDIRAWLSKLRSIENFKPDVIIIDYDDCLRPTIESDNMYERAGHVYSDLFKLLDYFDCPGLTFAQPRREVWEAMDQGNLINFYDIAHSAKKTHKATSISSINFKADSNTGVLWLDVVRRGRSKVKIKIIRDQSLGIIKQME